jgi:hypothetical protein
MIIEDQLDRGVGRIGGIEKLEEFFNSSPGFSGDRRCLAGRQPVS